MVLDSKAYRLLEKHLVEDIWSTLRDRPNMSAREIFDVLTETHLTGTVRSISTIEQEMEMTRMSDSATLTSHFSCMCRYFRELEMHGQGLNRQTENNQDDVQDVPEVVRAGSCMGAHAT
jgi:hypothetical protein